MTPTPAFPKSRTPGRGWRGAERLAEILKRPNLISNAVMPEKSWKFVY